MVLYTDHVLEFWVDDERYFGGDFYAFRRAPLVLHLQPGEYRVDVRIVRDVRVMGGVGEPTVHIALEAEISGGGLKFGVRTLVLPDLVGGRLAGTLGSVDLRNDEREWIDVLEIQSVNVCVSLINRHMHVLYHCLVITDSQVRMPSLSAKRTTDPFAWHQAKPAG